MQAFVHEYQDEELKPAPQFASLGLREAAAAAAAVFSAPQVGTVHTRSWFNVSYDARGVVKLSGFPGRCTGGT